MEDERRQYRITLTLDPRRDADVIVLLESTGDPTGYIRTLVRTMQDDGR